MPLTTGSVQALQVLRLPCTKVGGSSEAVDHTQRARALSAAPATQKQHPLRQVLNLWGKKIRGSADALTTGSAQAQ